MRLEDKAIEPSAQSGREKLQNYLSSLHPSKPAALIATILSIYDQEYEKLINLLKTADYHSPTFKRLMKDEIPRLKHEAQRLCMTAGEALFDTMKERFNKDQGKLITRVEQTFASIAKEEWDAYRKDELVDDVRQTAEEILQQFIPAATHHFVTPGSIGLSKLSTAIQTYLSSCTAPHVDFDLQLFIIRKEISLILQQIIETLKHKKLTLTQEQSEILLQNRNSYQVVLEGIAHNIMEANSTIQNYQTEFDSLYDSLDEHSKEYAQKLEDLEALQGQIEFQTKRKEDLLARSQKLSQASRLAKIQQELTTLESLLVSLPSSIKSIPIEAEFRKKVTETLISDRIKEKAQLRMTEEFRMLASGVLLDHKKLNEAIQQIKKKYFHLSKVDAHTVVVSLVDEELTLFAATHDANDTTHPIVPGLEKQISEDELSLDEPFLIVTVNNLRQNQRFSSDEARVNHFKSLQSLPLRRSFVAIGPDNTTPVSAHETDMATRQSISALNSQIFLSCPAPYYRVQYQVPDQPQTYVEVFVIEPQLLITTPEIEQLQQKVASTAAEIERTKPLAENAAQNYVKKCNSLRHQLVEIPAHPEPSAEQAIVIANTVLNTEPALETYKKAKKEADDAEFAARMATQALEANQHYQMQQWLKKSVAESNAQHKVLITSDTLEIDTLHQNLQALTINPATFSVVIGSGYSGLGYAENQVGDQIQRVIYSGMENTSKTASAPAPLPGQQFPPAEMNRTTLSGVASLTFEGAAAPKVSLCDHKGKQIYSTERRKITLEQARTAVITTLASLYYANTVRQAAYCYTLNFVCQFFGFFIGLFTKKSYGMHHATAARTLIQQVKDAQSLEEITQPLQQAKVAAQTTKGGFFSAVVTAESTLVNTEVQPPILAM